ncbi:putative transporter [Thozetella sp. PMI_491]|nr:putative transporter [Thozetella sp. PMI_491]
MPKPSVTAGITPRLLRIFLFASIGAMNFGYDNNWWAGVITLPSFIEDYGQDNGPGKARTLPSSWLSAASGTPIAGWIIGCLLAGFLTKSLGRKWTIVIICVIALIGMILQAAVLNYWVLMTGRLINAFSMGKQDSSDAPSKRKTNHHQGIEANTIPLYMAELATPALRGGLVNFYQSWLYIGALVAAVTVYGSSVTLTGMWTYRTAIIVQLAPPCMLLAAVWFIPESPRWLLSKDRKEDAFKALAYMRQGSHTTEEEVSAELNLIDRAMQEEKENHLATTYADCFQGTNLRRTIIAIGVQVLQQAQGNSFTTTYLVIFLQQIGLAQPLLINVAKMCCNFAATLLTFYLSDKLGRRPMLLAGSFFMGSLMWIISATSAWGQQPLPQATAQGLIAAILFYGMFAASCWGSVMWTVTAEVSTTQLRERTISIATLSGFINSPGYLGAKVGMIYGSISFLSIFFVYFFVPEMKGRSLEELDELFHAKVPAWKAGSYVCSGIGTQITNIQNAGNKLEFVDGKALGVEGTRENTQDKNKA